MKRLAYALTVAALLTVSACTNDDDAGDAGTDPRPSQTPDQATADEPDEEEATLGTWDDPLPAGTPVTLTGWEVTIGPATATTDALDPMLTEAEPGMSHLVSEVTATRTGDAPDSLASFDAGVSFSLMDGTGVEVRDTCATPDGLDRAADVAPGSEISGTHCAYISEDAIEGATWMVSEQGTDATAYISTE